MSEKQRNTNRFVNSVSDFSHNDVKGDPDKEKRALLPMLITRSALIGLCICLLGYAVFMIISNAVETNRVNEVYEDIRAENMAPAVQGSGSMREPAAMFTFQDMLDSNGKYKDVINDLIVSPQDSQRRSSYYRNYISFRSKYPDAYAWIYVNHTKIDYPVMMGGENTDYYLYHDYRGNASSSGSITAEMNLSPEYDANVNQVIYGHCMKNGSMFRTIKTFMESANRNTLANSMNIEIYTEKGLYIYRVFSGYRNDGADYAQTIFSNETEYLDFLKKIKSRNTLSVSQNYDSSSRICTLITCSNVDNNEDDRYVLHGILTSFIPADQL